MCRYIGACDQANKKKEKSLLTGRRVNRVPESWASRLAPLRKEKQRAWKSNVMNRGLLINSEVVRTKKKEREDVYKNIKRRENVPQVFFFFFLHVSFCFLYGSRSQRPVRDSSVAECGR